MSISKYYNNTLFIESNKKIKKDDLELILLFFENSKLTGGYDILKHELKKPNLLEITYKYNESKQEILKRNHFKYDKYELKVKQDLNFANQERKKLNNLLIFSNIDVISNEMLELYVDYLLQGDQEKSNSIENIVKSLLFQQTYYVYFKSDINYELFSKRLLKKPKLRDKEVKIYEAYELNQLIFGLNSLIKSDLNNFEDKYDTWFSKIDDKIYWCLPFREKSPFISVFFKKYSQVKKFMAKKFLVPNQGYLVCENVFNCEFIDDYFEKLFTQKLASTQVEKIFESEVPLKVKNEPGLVGEINDEPLKRKTYKEFEEDLPLAKLAKLEGESEPDEENVDEEVDDDRNEKFEERSRERKLSTDSLSLVLNRGRRETIIMGIKWCPYCKIKFSTKKDMQEHKRTEEHKEERRSAHREDRLCELCNQVFKTLELKEKHFQSYTHKVYASEYENYLINNPSGSTKIWKTLKNRQTKCEIIQNFTFNDNPVQKVISNDEEISIEHDKKSNKVNKILAKNLCGTVKSYSASGLRGFINSSESHRAIMFSKTNIRFCNPDHPDQGLYTNDNIIYDVIKVRNHNKIAINVRFIKK